MPDCINRSRFRVTVKNREDLTRHFSYNKLDVVKAYMEELRTQHLKPHVCQLDEHWLVRIRNKGHKPVQTTFISRDEADRFVKQVAAERLRGIFVDYTVSRKITLAELLVRYLLEEAPRQKSRKILEYSLEGWLADSGPAGEALLARYRKELTSQGKPVRQAKFQMRQSSNELSWLHKPFADVTTVDIELFINDRLEVVEASTVDREIDRLKGVFKVATAVWDYPLSKNPMDAVRRPKYFNERDRRISASEEVRLLSALAQLDEERSVKIRLQELAEIELNTRTFSSVSARKKVQAAARAALRPLAAETAHVVPYLQVFYMFQVMTGARRGETLGLTWDRIDFDAQTAFLPETKNGRSRKLALRQDLLEELRALPRDTERVFAVGLDYVVGAWATACTMAKVDDLHIHDVRHEALSRLAESGKFTLPELQVFSGHRDLRMLMRYAHLCASRLAAKLDSCFQDDGKVRIHRGRRFLNRRAGIAPSVLSDPSALVSTAPGAPSEHAEASTRGVPQPTGSNVIAFPTRQRA